MKEAAEFTLKGNANEGYVRLVFEDDDTLMFIDGDVTFAKELIEELERFITGRDRPEFTGVPLDENQYQPKEPSDTAAAKE